MDFSRARSTAWDFLREWATQAPKARERLKARWVAAIRASRCRSLDQASALRSPDMPTEVTCLDTSPTRERRITRRCVSRTPASSLVCVLAAVR